MWLTRRAESDRAVQIALSGPDSAGAGYPTGVDGPDSGKLSPMAKRDESTKQDQTRGTDPTSSDQDQVDDTTRESMENAARNAGYPTTSGDLQGDSED